MYVSSASAKNVCVYVCIYIYMCVCVCLHAYIYMYTDTDTYININVYILRALQQACILTHSYLLFSLIDRPYTLVASIRCVFTVRAPACTEVGKMHRRFVRREITVL